MSETFKSAHSDNKALKVDELFGNPRLLIKAFDGDTRGFVYAPSDAPALALAILEAAGFTSEDLQGDDSDRHFSLAVHHLLRGIEEREREAAEAKEQAELEAEALELYNACMPTHNLTSFDGLGGALRDQWLAVARTAREIAEKRAEK